MKLKIILSFAFVACFQFSQAQTKAEALATAQKLETIVSNGDAEALAAFFDLPAMMAILTEKSRAAKNEELMEGFSSRFSMKPFAQGVVNGTKTGRFQLLRHYEKDGKQHLLFRVLTGRGINYMDFHLTKNGDEIKGSDVKNYVAGDEMTTILAEMIDALVPEDVDPLDLMNVADTMIVMKQMMDRGEVRGVKEMFERLPQDLQGSKAMLIAYMEACKRISSKDYKAALEKFSRAYPNSPNAYLLLIDISALEKDYDKTLFAINKIDEIVEGDPILDYYRGNVYFLLQKNKESITCFEKVYAYDPELGMNMQALIAIYVKEEQVDKAKKIVETYKTSKGFDPVVLDLLNGKYPALKN
jgi:tetratricopeptide (TPR) repeat protein